MEINIDSPYVHEAWSLLFQQPVVRCCREVILKYIMEHGIRFEHSGNEVEVDDDTRRYWDRKCKILVPKILDWLLTVGVVPVVFLEGGGGASNDVTIAEPESGTVRGVWEEHHWLWHWVPRCNDYFPLSTLHTDPRVIILSEFGYQPHPSGQLRSLISSLIPEYHFISTLKRYALQAESIRSNPPCMLQLRSSAIPKERVPGFHWDIPGNYDGLKSQDQPRRIRSSQVESNWKEIRQRINKDYYKGGDAKDDARRSSFINPYELPDDRELVSQVLPVVRPDLLEMERQFVFSICSALGVPRSFLAHERNSFHGDQEQEGIHDHFRQTVQQWKHHMEEIMTFCYRCVTGELLYKKLMKKIKQRKLPPTDDELEDLHILEGIRIVFPSMPFISCQQTLHLQQQGILTFEEAVHHIRSKYNFSEVTPSLLKKLQEERTERMAQGDDAPLRSSNEGSAPSHEEKKPIKRDS